VVKWFGVIKNVEEPCVYKKVSGSAVIFLILYVDDILLVRNDISMMEAIKSSFRKGFSMKDLGETTYILRLIGLNQDAYIDKILNRFNMQDSKTCFLPMSHVTTLSKK
jgi:hypothetical protein